MAETTAIKQGTKQENHRSRVETPLKTTDELLPASPEIVASSLSPESLGPSLLTQQLQGPGNREQGARLLLELQRRYGNQRVQRALARLEKPREATRDSISQSPLVQQAADRNGQSDAYEVSPQIAARIEGQRGLGRPLEKETRRGMETVFQRDLSDVRVHTGPEADALNQEVQAEAFATGKDVFFREGNYAPESPPGKELLAHELTHVVQQQGVSVAPAPQVSKRTDPVQHEAEGAARVVERSRGEVENGHDRHTIQRQAVEGADAAPPTETAAAATWIWDPGNLLAAPRLNPEFMRAARAALGAASDAGLRPQVHEAYRTAERSDELYKKWKAGKGGRAAPGWASVHNYGLAMDVYLYDDKGSIISNTTHKGWYKEYKKLNTHLKAKGFEWGEPINDANHWEYHPGWKGLADGKRLEDTRKWAMDVAQAVDEAKKASVADWLQYFWWAAGAGGEKPASVSPAAKR